MNLFEPKLQWSLNEAKSDIFSVKFSKDQKLIGAALGNGNIGLYSGATGRLSYALPQSENRFPITCIRFHPVNSNTLYAVSAEGTISQWNTYKPQQLWSLQEENNQLFALDISANGNTFATAGLDKIIRVYSAGTNQELLQLSTSSYSGLNDDSSPHGHSNRIFSLKFNPNNENVLYSSGWDDTIQVWDIRTKSSIYTFFGSHVCSDSLDISGNILVSGSWRTNNQIQLWDIRSYTEKQTMKWNSNHQCLVYALKIHPSGSYLVAGGSGSNEVAAFSLKSFSQIGKTIQMSSIVYSLTFSNDGKSLVIGTSNGDLASYLLNGTSTSDNASSEPFLTAP